MFTHAPRLVQQRPTAPAVYERTPSHVPPLVPRSRALSFHQSPTTPLPFPTRKSQSNLPAPLSASRPSPEPWVDALKDDVEAEFSLSLVDDVKAEKDAALAAASTAEERAAIMREFDESMADIRAHARAEFQRRVEAERERRLLGNYHGKDALIAEQHTIMESIARDNMRREASQSSSSSAPLQTPPQVQAQSLPSIARPSQPIPIPVQRSRSRKGSVTTRSVPITPFASSSSSSSSRPFPSARRNSITQYSSTRPLPRPSASPATSVSSTSSVFEPSSSLGSSSAEMDRHFEDHRVAVQRREEEVKRKEAAARRSAEEARRREEAAARHEDDARRKNEEATRRMREAQLREQQVRALETRARKEIELAQKGAQAVRVRTQSQSGAAPLIARVFSKEVWQQKPRPATGATLAPRRETHVRA